MVLARSNWIPACAGMSGFFEAASYIIENKHISLPTEILSLIIVAGVYWGMKFVTSHKSNYLSSVSQPAMMVAWLYTDRSGHSIGVDTHGTNTHGVGGFLVWLRLWLDWMFGGGQDAPSGQAPMQNRPGRKSRRIKWRKIPDVRNLSLYRLLLGFSLSPRQFVDRVSRLSPLGRVRILRIRYWGNVLARRALLVCYDHGWWRAPIGEFGRMYSGVWLAHAWPGWQVFFKEI